jgi:hypothetical protein
MILCHPAAPVGSNNGAIGEDANDFQLRSIKLPPKGPSFGGSRARVKRNYSRNVGLLTCASQRY